MKVRLLPEGVVLLPVPPLLHVSRVALALRHLPVLHPVLASVRLMGTVLLPPPAAANLEAFDAAVNSLESVKSDAALAPRVGGRPR